MKSEIKNKYLHDVLLVLCLLAVSLVLFLVLRSSDEAGESFSVYLGGELYGEYPLTEDRLIEIDGICTISVSDHAVSVAYSNCPGQNCVHHAPVSKSGEIICCIPNGLVIRITGQPQYDFVI